MINQEIYYPYKTARNLIFVQFADGFTPWVENLPVFQGFVRDHAVSVKGIRRRGQDYESIRPHAVG